MIIENQKNTVSTLPIYASTGAFIGRKNGRDPRHFLSSCKNLPCDGFECMLYEAWYERLDEILELFLTLGQVYPVLHVEKRIGELIGEGAPDYRARAMERFLLNCRAAVALGSKLLVFHLWNGEPSDYHIDRHIGMYGEFLAASREYGLTLTVENVVCAIGSPLEHFLSLAERYPDVRFTFDTKMASFHDEVNLAFSDRYRFLWENHIAHLHINDHGGQYRDFSGLRTLHIGEGHLDFPLFFRRLAEVGYSGGMTLECASISEDGSLQPKKMADSLHRVRTLSAPLLKKGVL